MPALLVRSWRWARRPPWRTVLSLAAALLIAGAAYVLWSPGLDVRDGRHDRGRNGLWLGHGWLGDDAWFARHGKDVEKPRFRSAESIAALVARCRAHGITDFYPHLCPSRTDGAIPGVDAAQVERLLDASAGLRVMPWIGGVRGSNAFIDDAPWRTAFAASAGALLRAHPRLAGVHLNIETCPSGDTGYLALLDTLRAALPEGRLLSVAAYPPPTAWQRSMAVHWDRAYHQAVAARCDQLVVMAYDTGLGWAKPYQRLLADWTQETLAWSVPTPVLIGLPAYDDAGVRWHDPAVENLATALPGVHAGLARGAQVPAHFQGIAVYSEWEMDEREWALLRAGWCRPAAPARPPP